MKKLLLYTLFSVLLFANEHDSLETPNTTNVSDIFPHISVIIDTSYVNRSINNDEAKHLEIPEIAHGLLSSDSHAEHAHSINNSKNGFNFNYAELLLSKHIEDLFNFEAIFHFSNDKVEIDELYISTDELLNNLNIKLGKFRSNFGYINQFHHHSYSFSDMPLIYEGFLGSHGLNETGLQVEYKLPTSFDLKLGFEVLEGTNEQMYGNDFMALPLSVGATAMQEIDATASPSLYVAYAQSTLEIDHTDILIGMSYAKGTSKINHIDDEEPSAFDGESSLFGIDLLVKQHFIDHSTLTLQSELISRNMKGTTYSYDGVNNLINAATNKTHSGIYTQLVYEYNEHWSNGVRYENIYENSLNKDMDKYSIALTYSPMESTYFRLQYSRNNALYDEDLNRKSIDTVILQANFTIGYHKAHKQHKEHIHQH